MSSSPPSKRAKTSEGPVPTSLAPPEETRLPPAVIAPRMPLDIIPPPSTSEVNSRKRKASRSPKLDTLPPRPTVAPESTPTTNVSIPSLLTEDSGKKKGRTNTPWTAGEEQLLKQMRDTGNTWSEIAKAFPKRTEGSVKKHWYKDMHYAEFAEDETKALLEAIREYEANKWKVIGAKLGKPAKACEQFAKDNFKTM